MFLLDDDGTVVRFMVPANIWDEIRSRIHGKVNHLSYDTWFMPTTFVGDDDRTVTVSVPTLLFRDWIINHYSGLIAEAVEEVHRSDAVISFIVPGPPDAETEKIVIPSPDVGLHSIEERFNRVDRELAVIRRDVDLILVRLSAT